MINYSHFFNTLFTVPEHRIKKKEFEKRCVENVYNIIYLYRAVKNTIQIIGERISEFWIKYKT